MAALRLSHCKNFREKKIGNQIINLRVFACTSLKKYFEKNVIKNLRTFLLIKFYQFLDHKMNLPLHRHYFVYRERTGIRTRTTGILTCLACYLFRLKRLFKLIVSQFSIF